VTGGYTMGSQEGSLRSMTSEPIYLDHQATTPVDPRVIYAMALLEHRIREPTFVKHAFGWRQMMRSKRREKASPN